MTTTVKDKILILFLCGYLAVLPGCGSDGPTAQNNTQPEIPPVGTMSMDFSFFIQNGVQNLSSDALLDSQNYFAQAVVTVTLINVAVLLRLSIPVATIAAALSQTPTFDEATGKWHWNFQYPEVNPALTLELTGQINGDVVNWQMFVTRTLPTPLNNFLWFDGESSIDGTQGEWQFYDENLPDEQHPNGQITWTYNSDDDRTLLFANDNPDDAGFGDSLTYQVANEIITITAVDVSETDTTEISWNRNTGEGHIVQDGVKGCWDQTFQDTACPDAG